MKLVMMMMTCYSLFQNILFYEEEKLLCTVVGFNYSIEHYTIYFHIFSVSGLSLNGQSIANNSNVVLRNIGEGTAALLCTTDSPDCCTGTGRAGEWFYPDGRMVPRMIPALPATPEPYYRNRDTSLIRLNRRSNLGLSVNYTGVYCCKIPDQNNVMQTLCVGAYLTESAGQFIVLIHLYVCITISYIVKICVHAT